MTDAFRQLEPGAELRVLTDKWSVVRDLEAYAHATGHGYHGWKPVEHATETWWVTLSKRHMEPGAREMPG